jgi:hypothetical protein
MSYKNNFLLKFSAYYLFLLAGLFGIVLLSMLALNFSKSDPVILYIIIVIIALICLFIASGIGLLKRKKWAKVASIIAFLIIALSTIGSLNSPSVSDNLTYNISNILTKLAMFGGSGLGLYALIVNQSVKSYFD